MGAFDVMTYSEDVCGDIFVHVHVMTHIEDGCVHVHAYIHAVFVLLVLFKCCISAVACVLDDCGYFFLISFVLFLLLPHTLSMSLFKFPIFSGIF